MLPVAATSINSDLLLALKFGSRNLTAQSFSSDWLVNPPIASSNDTSGLDLALIIDRD